MFLDYPLARNSMLKLCFLRDSLEETPHSALVIAQQAKPGQSPGSLSRTLASVSTSLGSPIPTSTPRLLALQVNKLVDTVREPPGTFQGIREAKSILQPILILKNHAYCHLTRGVHVCAEPRRLVPNVKHLAERVRDLSVNTLLLLQLHIHTGSILSRGLVLNINHIAETIRDPSLNTQLLLRLHVHLGSLLLRGALPNFIDLAERVRDPSVNTLLLLRLHVHPGSLRPRGVVPNVKLLVHLIWIPPMSTQTIFQLKIHSKGVLP
jgi:hypothetical protein